MLLSITVRGSILDLDCNTVIIVTVKITVTQIYNYNLNQRMKNIHICLNKMHMAELGAGLQRTLWVTCTKGHFAFTKSTAFFVLKMLQNLF